MEKNLPKTIGMFALFVATLGILSSILMSLHKDAPVAEKAIVKNTDLPKPKPRGILKEALMPKQTELELCYDQFLQTRPEVSEGAVTVHWLVNPQGSVLSTELAHSEIPSEDFTNCVLEKLKGMSFSAPPEARPTWLSYKFHFRHKAQTALHFAEE